MPSPTPFHSSMTFSETVRREYDPVSLGRNRLAQVTGYDISEIMGNVWLEPINTRGHTTRGCRIEIPGDPETLRALARQLNEAADSRERRTVSGCDAAA